MIGAIILLALIFLFAAYGYRLLVRRANGGGREEESAQCHLCKRSFPVGEMVAREKEAGFVNYFCGDCIKKLYADHLSQRRRN